MNELCVPCVSVLPEAQDGVRRPKDIQFTQTRLVGWLDGWLVGWLKKGFLAIWMEDGSQPQQTPFIFDVDPDKWTYSRIFSHFL